MMIKKLLFVLLGSATISASAQLNTAGTGYTLNNTSITSQCNISDLGLTTNAGIMTVGTTLTASASVHALPTGTTGPLELTSVSTVPVGGTPTWFALPVVDGSACSSLFTKSQGVNMTNDSKVSITFEASAAGAVLELWIGTGGPWNTTSSTYSTNGSSIFATSTATAANTSETVTFDYATLDATVWAAWTERNLVQAYGFRSGTNGAVFKITEIKFGSDVSAVVAGTCSDGIKNQDETGIDCGGATCSPCTSGATCSDGIQNQDETGVDCGGASCSACAGGGGGNGQACTVTNDDGSAQATYYTLLETGVSSIVTCTFDAVADIKGTFYGALETKTLHGSGTAPNFSDPAKYCGMCVSMKGPLSTQTVHITDECPDCWQHNTGNTDIDLSTPAFNAIVGNISIGRSNITWKEIPCPWTSPLQVIIQGSNEWSAKVIIANHVNRIASVEVMWQGTWQHMTRKVDNGWEKGSMNGTSKDFRITDIYGEQITVTGLDFTANPTNSKNYATGAVTNFTACGLTTSIELVNSLEYVSVYPNPANDYITLEGLEGVQSFQIINLNGQVVASETLGGNTSVGGVDISSLPSGIYVIRMTGNTATGTATFVKN